MSEPSLDRRVLVLAPMGRDALLAVRVLTEAGFAATVCDDVARLTAELARGAGTCIVTEEALAPTPRGQLRAALNRQPIWSDLQLVVCFGPAETALHRDRLARVAAELGNVNLLVRPFHPEALVGTVRAALRARERQYQTRELMARLEDAVRQREQFLATLSHELRNPLAAIRGAVQLALPAVPAETRLRRPLDIIDRQSRQLARLVDDLLDVSRVTTGKINLQRATTDLRALLEWLVRQLQPTIDEHGLTLVADLAEEPCLVDGDVVRLEQIFTNLLMNAIKYTPRGGKVTLALRPAGGALIVRVIDSGVGMSPETLEHVFDLFAQANQSLDRAQGGMGIGLTVARALAELHGGTVSAASAGVGRGSELTVTLPALGAGVAATPSAQVDHAPPPPRHILIVEDSADNRETLQEILQYEGHRVDVAVDGPEAVEVATRTRPEVAIIDIGLPGMDGYEVARRLRADLGSEILLLALTGYGLPEDRVRSADAGFDGHLTKPPDMVELYAKLAGR